MNQRLIVVTLSVVALIMVPAVDAYHWDETTNGGGDAGIQTTPQLTAGGSGLETISGVLDPSMGDHVDCYAIKVLSVSGEAGFYATTDPGIDPDAVGGDLDTRMWIWEFSGDVISGNDDSPDLPGFYSVVADPTGPIVYTAAPGNPVTTALVDGNDYIICLSYYPNDPDDAGGNDLVILSPFVALNGPNPAAGAFSAYEDSGSDGPYPYTMAFQAAAGTAIPVELMLLTVD